MPGLIHCFSPDHDDHNPSCQVTEETFFCHSGRCGIHGDIYDAIGILEGIPDKKEQYLFAEKYFDGGPVYSAPRPAPPKKDTEEEEAESFIRDTEAEAVLEGYLVKYPKSKEAITAFLKQRAMASTFGQVRDYPADIAPELAKHFFYWPGIAIVKQKVSEDILIRCGIVHPEKKTTSWVGSGVVLKLGTGYKLFYYKEGICEKRNTIKSHPFPMPGQIDTNNPVILVEAEMNAISSLAIGIKNIFSTGGTEHPTKPQIKHYLLNVPEIVLFFDADESGHKAMGLIPSISPTGKKLLSMPEKLIKAGYTGKIKIAILPPIEETGFKDQDALVINGKREIILKAIQGAKEYIPLETGTDTKQEKAAEQWEAYDTITVRRLISLLKKIPREILDDADIQPFITACLKSCEHGDVRLELAKWGASIEELDNKDETSPYFLIDICEKYEVSKYLKSQIEKALVPASELLKRMAVHPTIVKIDFEKIEKNDNALQFIQTGGVHSAALMIADILDGQIIYLESEKRHYFFNGHTWTWEPDMANVTYNLLCAVLRHLMSQQIGKKGTAKSYLWDLMKKIEGRRFRVEVAQDFSGLPVIFNETVLFDGPQMRETLTLKDGVMDFSGPEIEFRKSKRE
jgi:hypothetical protein